MNEIIRYLSDKSKPIIICDELKFIYIRNSRTASTSLYRNLLQKQIKVKTLNSRENPNKFKKWLKSLDQDKWDSYFKFSGVRNPWDRIVSVYFYIVKDRYKITFDNYIKNIKKYDSDSNLYAHRKPCSDHTHHNDKQMVDFVYKYENITKDFKHIAKMIGLNKAKLPHVNKTNHQHYRKYYDSTTKKIISNLLSSDIKNFGYKY